MFPLWLLGDFCTCVCASAGSWRLHSIFCRSLERTCAFFLSYSLSHFCLLSLCSLLISSTRLYKFKPTWLPWTPSFILSTQGDLRCPLMPPSWIAVWTVQVVSWGNPRAHLICSSLLLGINVFYCLLSNIWKPFFYVYCLVLRCLKQEGKSGPCCFIMAVSGSLSFS